MTDAPGGPSGRDWFAHSATVPPDAAAAVGEALDRYVADVERHVGEAGLTGVNLHLSGSLARQEPAVRRIGAVHGPPAGHGGPTGHVSPTGHGVTGAGGWTYTLASDVDLVAVTAEPGPGGGLAALGALSSVLAALSPGFETSVLPVRGSRLPYVRSAFGHDLWTGYGAPVARTFPAPPFPEPVSGDCAATELVTHQLAAALGESEPAAFDLAELSPSRAGKLCLEGLRAAAAAGGLPARRFSDLYRHRDDTLWRGFTTPQVIDDLVRRRELSLHARPFPCDVLALLTACLGLVLAGSADTGADALAAGPLTAAADAPDLATSFPAVTALIALLPRLSGPHRRRCAATLVRATDPSGRTTARPAAIAEGDGTARKELWTAWQRLRARYTAHVESLHHGEPATAPRT
ncbi:hypothetical protein ACIPPJ_31290 [Streptomyces sp. NPDC086091]|uniref:hypothetical protein n=1 Tax=Streptomyces sp. NPDC086091 TaxID=3365751 RepID=UPI003820B99D